MLKEAIEKLQSLAVQAAQIQQFQVDGRTYLDRDVERLQAPQQHTETVTTLTGFVELAKLRINNLLSAECFISVDSPTVVSLSDLVCDEWGRRQCHLVAKLPDYGRFPFGSPLDQEQFIIGLQTYFDPAMPDMANLLKLVGNLTAENVKTSKDDGVSQSAAVRTGVILAEGVEVKSRVELRPWRTFREVEQPTSKFIFRLKNREGQVPAPSLHVADGEMWQLAATQAIREWIKDKMTHIAVVA